MLNYQRVIEWEDEWARRVFLKRLFGFVWSRLCSTHWRWVYIEICVPDSINAQVLSEDQCSIDLRKKCEAPCYLRHHPWHPIDCWFQLSHPEQYIWDGVRNQQVNSPGCLKPQPTCAENLTSNVWHWVFPVPMKSDLGPPPSNILDLQHELAKPFRKIWNDRADDRIR